jgi:hypothetical protein
MRTYAFATQAFPRIGSGAQPRLQVSMSGAHRDLR